MHLRSLCIVLALGLASGCVTAAQQVVVEASAAAEPRMVEGDEALHLVESGALLIDVRSPAEFEAGHLTGARNIPVEALTDRAAELGSLGTPVVLYCKKGPRSDRAGKALQLHGFRHIYVLGAMEKWPGTWTKSQATSSP